MMTSGEIIQWIGGQESAAMFVGSGAVRQCGGVDEMGKAMVRLGRRDVPPIFLEGPPFFPEEKILLRRGCEVGKFDAYNPLMPTTPYFRWHVFYPVDCEVQEFKNVGQGYFDIPIMTLDRFVDPRRTIFRRRYKSRAAALAAREDRIKNNPHWQADRLVWILVSSPE